MGKFKKIFLLISLIFILIITQTSCVSEIQPVSKDNYYLDTMCNISVYATDESGNLDEEKAEKAIDKAYKLCASLEKALSKTVEASDISKINNADGAWVPVGDYTMELLERGLEYSKLSEGKFDITVGGITGLWDFHTENPSLPDKESVNEAVKHIGYDKIEISDNNVRLVDYATQLDLGGIAKGYIGDKMVESLIGDGITSAIVNLGGNVICIGEKSESQGFTIGIEMPFSDRTEIVGSINVRDKTLVTSGIYERMFEINDKIYHHILDTKTGYPVESDLTAVTLIADRGHSVDCDALSTICLISGYEKAQEIINSQSDIEAVFVLSDGNIKTTDGANFEKK